MIDVGVPADAPREADHDRRTPPASRADRRAAAARHGDVPGAGDPAQRRPAAQHRAHQRRRCGATARSCWSPAATRRSRRPGPDELYAVGVLGSVARMVRLPDGTLRVLIQGGPRVRVKEWVSRPSRISSPRSSAAPDEVRESAQLEALARNVQRTFSSIVGQVPYLPEELQVMVANVDDPVMLSHLIAGALRLPTDEKQALLEELDVTKRLRRLSEILARELEVVALGHQDPVPGPVRAREGPARVLPAPAAQGDPGRAGRGRRGAGRGQRAARPARGAASLPEEVAQAGRARAGPARAAAAGDGRVRRRPHLPGVDRVAAVGHVDRGQPRPRARPRGARRPTTTTSSRSRTASSSSWRCGR